MCFTATGSFAAAGILTGISLLTLNKTKSKKFLMFACTPLGFAIQQLAEGILWLTIANKQYATVSSIATYIFLILAFIVWPLWIPLALRLPAKSTFTKNLLSVLFGFGLLISAYSTYMMLNATISAQVVSHGIKYNIIFNGPFPRDYHLFFYMFPTILPFFVSKISLGRVMGTAIAIALVATYYFKKVNLVSVWCFFAAIISILIFFIIQREEGI